MKVFRSFLLLSDGVTDMCQVGANCYATAANDSTIRVWINPFNNDPGIPRVLYNKEMSQIFYTTSDYRHMKVQAPDFVPDSETVVGAV
ncbi:MAG: hypothetical protein V2I33_19205, partial [Kangiellaceae bacterium]|nr:hypothetical protein [Kangiellaceae bacterium]